MSKSVLPHIRRVREFIHISEVSHLPNKIRGIYVLYKSNKPKSEKAKPAEVVYVGLARTSILHRLISHKGQKQGKWTHASAFEVWPNIGDEEIKELEGLFRHIYRRDTKANKLNDVRTYRAILALEKIPLKSEKDKA